MPDPVVAPPASADPAAASQGPPADPVVAAGDAARAAANQADPAAAPVAPAAKPAEDKVPAALRAVQQRERALLERQQQLAAQSREFDQRVAQAVEKAVAERMGALKADPIAALRAQGFTDEEIARRLLGGTAKPSADELARQALEAQQKLQNDIAQDRARQASAAAAREFMEVAKDETKFPHLNEEWEPAEVVQQAHTVVDRLRKQGVDVAKYTYAEIAAYLNDVAKGRAARREKIKAARSTKGSAQAETKAEGNGVPDQGAAPGKTATTTLGSGLGERQTLNGKPGHLLSNAELARAVDAEVARTLSAQNGRA